HRSLTYLMLVTQGNAPRLPQIRTVAVGNYAGGPAQFPANASTAPRPGPATARHLSGRPAAGTAGRASARQRVHAGERELHTVAVGSSGQPNSIARRGETAQPLCGGSASHGNAVAAADDQLYCSLAWMTCSMPRRCTTRITCTSLPRLVTVAS